MGAVGCNGAMGFVRGSAMHCNSVVGSALQWGLWGNRFCYRGCSGAMDTVGFTVVLMGAVGVALLYNGVMDAKGFAVGGSVGCSGAVGALWSLQWGKALQSTGRVLMACYGGNK